MALQLLKRNYEMQGYEAPKILKLPQGEMRWSRRRLPVDIGDVMMNIRLDDSKNKFVGEHISKYAKGVNPYGEWGYPYKVNKNNIRPPIIDPKFYEPISRMPVKFDAITVGPIVKNLYEKKISIEKVAPNTITNKVCTDVLSNPSSQIQKTLNVNPTFDLESKPRTSIPYHPSMPIFENTGVPDIELQGKMIVRPQAGIHFPFHHSDFSRDVQNMRTPMHVAVQPGYKDPFTFVNVPVEEVSGIATPLKTSASTNIVAPAPTISEFTHPELDLTPKIKTSAWYNPSYYLTDLSGFHIGQPDSCTRDNLKLGSFEGKEQIPVINEHLIFKNTREPFNIGYTTPINEIPNYQNIRGPQMSAIREIKPINFINEKRGVEPPERINPIGTGRFIL